MAYLVRRRSGAALACSAFNVIEAMELRTLLSGTIPMSTPTFVAFSSNGNQSVASLTDRLAAGSGSPSGLTPAQIRGAYGLGNYGSSNVTFNGVQGDGTGETIALIDALNAPTIVSDLSAFDARYSLPNPPSFQVLNENGGTIANQTATSGTSPAASGTSGDSIESTLDVEWAHVMAPQASIILYEANSLSDSDLFTAALTAAKTTGVAVASMSFGGSEPGGTTQTNFDKDFLTPSGHAGVTFFASTGDTGASVEYPAESPNVVAVGGTTISVAGSGSNYSWSSESAWSNGGGGTSANESQPSYQAGTITASKREDPDVSIDANPNSGVPIYDAYDEGANTPWATYGGTSLSSPMWAGIVAVADQGRSIEGDTGIAASLTGSQTLTRLYQLSKANFHDITVGSNGHSAVVGYDEATGIGTPITTLLIPDLAGAATVTGRLFSDNAGTGVYASSDAVFAGQSVYLDLNNDGVQDNGEPSTTTNSQGIYTFTDEPAGGTVRLSSAAPAGYTLTSASTGSITYGSTDTVNFTYKSNATQLAFSQQPPTSTVYGTALSPVTVTVENNTGGAVTTNTSTVTLTLSSGTFANGTNTTTAVASAGVATFSGLKVGPVGSYTMTASDGALSTAVSNSFSITQGTPIVSWPTPASIPYGTALSNTQLDATANVAGTFVYSPAVETILSAGSGQSLTVAFTPTDSTDYTTANGSTTITVTKASPVITWADPASITYGTALSGTQLDASANTSGTFVYTPAAGTVLGAGTDQELDVQFTPADTADYRSLYASADISVLQATPTLNWPAPAPINYGTALSSAQLDATASVPGSFVYNPPAGTVLDPGAGQSLGVAFTPTDTTDYTTAAATVSIDVTGVTSTPINLTGSTFYVKLDSASPQNVDIWTNSNASGAPALVQAFSTVSSITLTSVAAGDSFTADFSNGSVVPTGGLTFAGYGSASGNTVTLVGTGGSDTVDNSAASATVSLNSQSISDSNTSTVFFAPVGRSEALNVSGGSVSLVPSSSGGISTDSFGSISIASGAELVVPRSTTSATRLLVQTGSLAIAGSASRWTGTLDLNNNDLDLANGNLAAVNSQVAQGYSTGIGGIISSVAETDPTGLTTLGVIQNSVDGTPTGAPLYGSGTTMGLFDSANPDNTDVLVKYTYFGDANLDGTVDGSDYSLVDNGFHNKLSGWFNGDFNYDNLIDGSDYTLIDNAFNTQGASFQATIAPANVISAASVVDSASSPASASKSATGFTNPQVAAASWLSTWNGQSGSAASDLTGSDSDKLRAKSIFSAEQILE